MARQTKRAERHARLNKRLAAYSAMAAVAATAGTSANAAPVVHDIMDINVGQEPGLLFNMVTGTTTSATTSSGY